MAIFEPGRAREIMDRLPSPVGYGLLAVGVALLVLPGPGIPFVLGGLAVLARRRPWARRARRRLRVRLGRGLRSRGQGPRRQPRSRNTGR